MKLFNSRHFLRHISLPTLREFTDARPLGNSLAIDWTGAEEALPNQICDAVAAIEAGLLRIPANVTADSG